MRSLAELYAEVPRGVGGYQLTDKADVHSYVDVYERLFAAHRKPGVRLLEIGLFRGASMLVWEKYFDQGDIWGVDVSDQPHGGLADLRPMLAERQRDGSPKHNIEIFDATDPAATARHLGQLSFDIIIDDAAHNPPQQLALYANFRDRLRPGGIYVIEDIENIDRDRALFENIDPTCRVEIVDRRTVKGRFDDVLVIIRKS